MTTLLPKTHCVAFLYVGDLKDIMFNPHLPDGISLTTGEPPVMVKLTGVSHPVKYRAQVEISCELVEFDFITNLIKGKYIVLEDSPLSLPHLTRAGEKIAADGTIAEGYGMFQHHLPPRVRTLCKFAREHLASQVARVVRTFRWAQNVDAPHNAFSSEGGALYWKAEATEESFRGVPLESNTQKGRSPIGIRWDEDDRTLLSSLLASDLREPLAHELQRESIALLPDAPRSALLMLSSALEVGVKQHVASVAPSTAWLLEELPSPPIHKILRRYLPLLHSKRCDIEWEKLRDLCADAQKLIEIRNKIAHAGQLESGIDLIKYVGVVNDWLYLLDYLAGHAWATDHVSHTTRTKLGWPPSSYDIFHFEVLKEE